MSRRLASEVDVFCGNVDEDMVGQIITTAGVVTSVRQSFTKDRRPFVSAILEDFAGSLEVTAWPNVYERTKDCWQEGQTLLVKGKVKSRNDGAQLDCYTVSLYQSARDEVSIEEDATRAEPGRRRCRLNIALPTSEDAAADIDRLRDLVDLLKRYPGGDQVCLTIMTDEGPTKLQMQDLSIDCGPDLRSQIHDLIGDQDVAIEDLVS
jgi:DNA polymerase-3 subunit alpha